MTLGVWTVAIQATMQVSQVAPITLQQNPKAVQCTDAPSDNRLIQEALSGARQGGIVWVSEGMCDLGTTTISIDGAARLVGSGRNRTILRYSGEGAALQVNSGVGITTHGWSISDLTLTGAGVGRIGLRLGQTTKSPWSAGGQVQRVSVTGFVGAGIELRAAQLASFIDVHVEHNAGDGVSSEPGPNGTENDFVHFQGCRFRSNGRRGVILRQYDTMVFDGSNFEMNRLEAILVERAARGSVSTKNLTIRSCWFENNNTGRLPAEHPAQIAFSSEVPLIENTIIDASRFAGRGADNGERHVAFSSGTFHVTDNVFQYPDAHYFEAKEGVSTTVTGRSSRVRWGPLRQWGGLPPSCSLYWEHAGMADMGRLAEASVSMWVNGGAGVPVKIQEMAGSTADARALRGPRLGFNGAQPIPRPTVSGSRAGNAALEALIKQLTALGLVIDETTP